MLIIQDAIGYEYLGKLLNDQGWLAYFQTGPNREPVYPFLISISMRLGDYLHLPYAFIQKYVHIILMLLTQCLVWKILDQLKTHTLLICAALLYIAFSPALINSTFSLFCEIATYPFILLLLLCLTRSWMIIQNDQTKIKMVSVWAIRSALLSILLTLQKGVFELIIPILVLPFLFIFFSHLKNNKQKCVGAFLFSLIFLLGFYSAISIYKGLNQKFNGQYVVTNRGSFALYGNIARRNQPLNAERLKTAWAFVPGENVCIDLFGHDACRFWSYRISDDLAKEKEAQLTAQNLSQAQISKEFNKSAIQLFRSNPFKQIFFMGLESLKMFFWETRNNIGFVVYPSWMTQFYEHRAFFYILSFVTATFALISLIYTLVWLTKNASNEYRFAFLLFSIILTLSFIGLHSFFFVLPRYALPIVPLFVILIAFLLQQTIINKIKES